MNPLLARILWLWLLLIIPYANLFAQSRYSLTLPGDYTQTKLTLASDTIVADSFLLRVSSKRFKQPILEKVYYRTVNGKELLQHRVFVANIAPLLKGKSLHDTLHLNVLVWKDTAYQLEFDTTFPRKLHPPFVLGEHVNIHGFIKTETVLSDGILDYQLLPQNYTRTSGQLNMDIGSLPFIFSFLHSTEGNQVSNFRFSFDHARFQQNLQTKIAKRSAEIQELPAQQQQLTQQISEARKKRLNLNNELQSPSYKLRREQALKDVQYNPRDTQFVASIRYQKAQQFLAKDSLYQLQLLQYDSLTHLMELRLQQQQSEQYTNLNQPYDKNLTTNARTLGVGVPYMDLLNGIKRFDIGVFTPAYNTLILDAVQLFGVNTALQYGKVYLAFTGGRIRNGIGLQQSYQRSNNDILALRIGLKHGNKWGVIFTGARSKGFIGTSGLGEPEANNTIARENIGVEINYTLHPNLIIYSEVATSSYNHREPYVNNFAPLPQATTGALSHRSAWLVGSRYRLTRYGTRLETSCMQTGPDYFSPGAPYLRRDDLRINFKGEQPFYKRHFTVFTDIRSDRDNLYNSLSATTYTLMVTAGLRINFNKLPYVILSYSPVRQQYLNTQQQKQTTRFDAYQVSSGYQHNGVYYQNFSTLSWLLNTNETIHSFMGINNLTLHRQLAFMHTLTYKPYQVSLFGQARLLYYRSSFAGDTISPAYSGGYEFGARKQFAAYKLSIEGSTGFTRENIPNFYRRVYKIGINCILVKVFTLTISYEGHQIYRSTPQKVNLFRIALMTSF